MTSEKDTPVLDATIRVDKLPATGRRLSVVATPEQCALIAERLGIFAVERFSATLTATSFRGGIRIEGPMQANVVQACVVTQEPVSQLIDETVDRIFLPGKKREEPAAPGSEVFVDLEGEDAPDYYDGTELDLTDLLMEVLSLALDPYPRKPGASIDEWLKPEDRPESISPFSKLKALKPGKDK